MWAARWPPSSWPEAGSDRNGAGSRADGLHQLARSSDARIAVETVDIMVLEEVAARHDQLVQATQAGKGGLQ